MTPTRYKNDLHLLEQISRADIAATEKTRTVVTTHAFKLLLNPTSDFFGSNWATPQEANPSPLEIEEMRQAFVAHQRKPRLEFIEECWPQVAKALERAGFEAEGTPQEIMVVSTETFVPYVSEAVTVQFLEADDSDELLHTYLWTQTRAFGYGGTEPTPQEISSWRAQICGGRHAALAFLDTRAVGVGTVLGSDLCELQGVATLPEARRHGVAASLSSVLVARALQKGLGMVWLSVEDDFARGCYHKIGFYSLGSRLNYSLS